MNVSKIETKVFFMITFNFPGHTILLPDNVVKVYGKKVLLVNPVSIKKLLKALVKYYPVKSEDLPELFNFQNIESETLPNHYAVCSIKDFDFFVNKLKNSVDTITLNDFLFRNKIISCELTLK